MTTAQAAAFPAITKPSAQLNIAKATRAPQITQDSVGGLLYNGGKKLHVFNGERLEALLFS